jgi:DNA-binding LacI/PurR family transcriptional regulator
MREKIREAILELQYSPNRFAQRLSLGKSLTIGIAAAWFTTPSVVERIRGIEQVLSETQYDLNVYNIETIERRKRCFADIVRSGKVDGLLVISVAPNDEEASALRTAGIATVLIDAKGPLFSHVAIDDTQGGMEATNFLIGYGHKKIGFVSDYFSTSAVCNNSQEDRYIGYKQALEMNGLPFRGEYVRNCHHNHEMARQVATELLEVDKRPTAIFASSDTLAFGVIEAARDKGLRVPDDLSVIGYDDIEISAYLNLTTVRQPLLESGIEGAGMLLKALNSGNNEVEEHVLPTKIVTRGTVSSPRN